MENLILRPFEEKDETAVYELHIAGLKQTESLIGGEARKLLDKDLQDIKGTYINNGGEFLVVIEDNQLIGMGGLRRIDESTAEIKRMRVEPLLQGKGVGKLILDKLIERAKELGYSKLILDTSTKQKAAHHLYESRGFKEYKQKDVYGQETICYERDVSNQS